MATVIEYSPVDMASVLGAGAFGLVIEEDGGVVAKASVNVGLGRRNLEKISATMPMVLAVSYSDRIDYLAAPAYNWISATCYESLLNMEIPERAHFIRTILLEINRISSHLTYFSRVAQVSGQQSLANYCLREREKFSDLFEMYCGSRLGFGSICIGGVKEDATDGWLYKIEKALGSVSTLLGDLDSLLLSHPHFCERSISLLKISRQEAHVWSLTGPTARASGREDDLRRIRPYAGYGRIHVPVLETVPCEGDAWTRVKIRAAELVQSIAILRECFGKIPEGNHRIRVGINVEIPEGRAFHTIEGPRGEIGLLIDTTNGIKLNYFTPSAAVMRVLPELLNGLMVEDVLLAIQSLDLSISEVDK